MDLDEFEPRDLAVHGLDQRALAHAARAPKQRIVGGKPARESRGVGEQRIARGVDALEQRERHAVDGSDRQEALRLGLPDKGIACGEIGPLGLARTKPLDGAGDPLEKAGKGFLKVHVGPLQRRSRRL